MQDLRVSLVQGATRWHDPAGNRDYYGDLIKPLAGNTDLVILPETFTSGFSNDAIDRAEGMDGPTVAWIREQAGLLGAAVTGSVQLQTADGVFNRLLWSTPDGGLQYYDKRHLFRFAGEHKRYAAGSERLTVEWKGWRINPLVCYDLRFPVYSRNRYDAGTGTLAVSKIFDWYRKDFEQGFKGYSSLQTLFARYAEVLAGTPAGQADIKAGKYKLVYTDYDWSLNDAR